MNIYLISQNSNDNESCYTDAIVLAETLEEAQTKCPCEECYRKSEWVSAEDVQVLLLGKASEGVQDFVKSSLFTKERYAHGVVLASYNCP